MDLIPDPEKYRGKYQGRNIGSIREEYVPPPDIPEVGKTIESRWSTREREDLQAVLAEIHSRSEESLKIFQPMPEQDRFFKSEAPERLALGGNRGGKTLTTMVEVARAVTGQDPYDKYPKENGIFILVSKDLKKSARVFYRALFKPGAFKIIKDARSKKWRTYNPNVDWERDSEAKPAPPLIPQRFLKGPISFGSVKDEEPKTARLKNGWQIWFYSSRSELPQGVAVDGACFDEELERDGWYSEMMARLVDRRSFDRKTGKMRGGKFIWSATPQSGTPILYDLYSRAIEEEATREEVTNRGEVPKPATIETFHFDLISNPFIAEYSKDILKGQYESNRDEYEIRIHGRFALFGSKIYPEFDPRGVHGCEAFAIPDDWCRYIFVDPGRQVCAVLFVAIPPPVHPWRGRKVIYDELYIRQCNALMFADALVAKVGDNRIHKGFIDHRAGRMTDVGYGQTIEYQYTEALRNKKFTFEVGGSTFSWSSDDVKSGIAAVHNMLHLVDGQSEIVVFHDKLPNLLWEMPRYSYRKMPNGLVATDEPIKKNDHQCDNMRYMASADIVYVKPRKKERKEGYAHRALSAKRERIKHAKRADGISDGSVKVW